MTPVLTDGSLTLVPLVSEHRAAFLEIGNALKHKQRHAMHTEQQFEGELITKPAAQEHYYVWMIEQSGILRGVINCAAGKHPQIFQGGYWVHPDHWGKGIAPAALELVKEFLFTRRNAVRLQAIVEPDNLASMRVLEKCGYEKEGLLRKFYAFPDGLCDVCMYSCIKP